MKLIRCMINRRSRIAFFSRIRGSGLIDSSQTVKRTERCDFCGSDSGLLIGKITYWDLATANVVQCTTCYLSQLDPMLTNEIMAKGCEAYANHEAQRLSRKWKIRDQVRTYRKGFVFSTKLRSLGKRPKRILELGPSAGFFSRAVRDFFPASHVTVMDVVPSVLEYNKNRHGFETIHGQPDLEWTGDYDLIIARDLLEHIAHPERALRCCVSALRPSGVLYILTPNGYEDIWAIYQRWYHFKSPVELLGNHANYFDPKGLYQQLHRLGLQDLKCRIVWLKGFLRGDGWLYDRSKAGPQSISTESGPFLDPKAAWPNVDESITDKAHPQALPPECLTNSGFGKTLLYLWYRTKTLPRIELSTHRAAGHYISLIMEKQ